MHPRARDACRVRTPGRGHGSPGVSPNSIHLVFEEGTSIARVMLDTFVRSWQWFSVLPWCHCVFRSKFRFCVGHGNFSGKSQDLFRMEGGRCVSEQFAVHGCASCA